MSTRAAFPSAGRRLARLAVAAIIAVVSLIGLANPAAAGAYASGGNVGVHYLSQTNCRWIIGDRVLTMNVDPPTIYAFNYRAGGGNDSDYVRYQAYLVDYNTGRALQSTGYSGWASPLTTRLPASTAATSSGCRTPVGTSSTTGSSGITAVRGWPTGWT